MASNHPTEQTDLEVFSGEILDDLARRLPICLSSDEFHFFPQAVCPDGDWSRWDDFSPGAVAEMAERLRGWEERLLGMAEALDDPEDRLDADLLARVLATVREQLVLVRVPVTQPTWHLTIAGIGLAEGLEAGEPSFEGRVAGLPRFLETAGEVLSGVPVLFRDLGLEMADGLRGWLKGLPSSTMDLSPAVEALDRFTVRLRRLPTSKGFRLELDLLAKILAEHLGTGMTPEAIRSELLSELAETREILTQESERILPGRSWRDALASLPGPGPSPDGGIGHYRKAIEALADHCATSGLVDPEVLETAPVRVAPVPSYLSAVRSSAAYSMPPGHPPTGGTFFVTETGGSDSMPKDLRLLSTHETYPGHHLLDTRRWGLARTIRRHLEFPLFYEGWACFSEELLSELAETREILEQEADRILPGRSWRDALAALPAPGPSSDGGIGHYREAIENLGAHCVAAGLVDPEVLETAPVRVAPVPSYLSAVRSSAAYSMPPGHPPTGGTFFVTEADGSDSMPKDLRLLSAHETYPGHHLLDTRRWGLARTVRRHLEFPLFYEGWACFSEELLFHTGFFKGPADRLLLAKRRFWRAMRGLADLDLHTGRTDLAGAARTLAEAGRDPDQARAMVRRYALKPGYQICYAIGMRRFRTLYQTSKDGGHTPATFARTVLAQGEVGFPALERRLRAGRRRPDPGRET